MAKTAKSLLCYIDVDNGALSGKCKKHGVEAMPTLVYMKGGQEVDRMKGIDRSKLEGWANATA